MQTANHILSVEGILTTFQIAKKVSQVDIKKIRDKMKSANVDATKFQDIIKQMVLSGVEKSIEENKIPGLLLENNTDRAQEERKIIELTYFSSLISKKITEKKISKYHSCYIVNAIVNMLGLNDKDFESFHRKFERFKNGGPPEEDSPTFS